MSEWWLKQGREGSKWSLFHENMQWNQTEMQTRFWMMSEFECNEIWAINKQTKKERPNAIHCINSAANPANAFCWLICWNLICFICCLIRINFTNWWRINANQIESNQIKQSTNACWMAAVCLLISGPINSNSTASIMKWNQTWFKKLNQFIEFHWLIWRFCLINCWARNDYYNSNLYEADSYLVIIS